MALRTLRAMALGGMRDHIGGGFHRYSVDAAWRVPHFEKMLYDQAQLVLAFVEAAQASGDPFYLEVAEDTLLYVMREMTDPDGGFYSAEDADSVPPEQGTGLRRGSPSPIRRKARSICGAPTRSTRCSGTTRPSSSSASGSSRTAMRRPIRSRSSPARTFCTWRDRSTSWRPASGKTARRDRRHPQPRRACAMFQHRLQRPRPHRDDKILTAWNGLMIAAFARMARVLGAAGDGRPGTPCRRSRISRPRVAPRGSSASACGMPTRRQLLRSYRDGHAAIDAYAEDYAYLIFGLLELFQADPDPMWLEWAIALQHRQDELFWDEARGRLVQHDGDGSERPAADERGLRRRRADGELRLGDESAGALAPGGRAGLDRSDRSDAPRLRRAARADGPRRADDGGGAFHPPGRRPADRHRRRREGRRGRQRFRNRPRARRPLSAVCDSARGSRASGSAGWPAACRSSPR